MLIQDIIYQYDLFSLVSYWLAYLIEILITDILFVILTVLFEFMYTFLVLTPGGTFFMFLMIFALGLIAALKSVERNN